MPANPNPSAGTRGAAANTHSATGPGATHTGAPAATHSAIGIGATHTGAPAATGIDTPDGAATHTGALGATHTATGPGATHSATGPGATHTGAPAATHTGAPAATHSATGIGGPDGTARCEAFRRRGAVVVRGLLDSSWCERLHRAIERCQASPSQFYGVLSPPGEPRVDSDLFRWFDDPDIAEATHSSNLAALGAELCGSDAAVLIEDQWFCSEPGAASRSPWHQDHPYYNLDRPFVTVWVTLDDVSADAALRVVEGSHTAGVTYAPIEFSSSTTTIGGASELAPVPDVDALPEQFPVSTWDLRAGDAVAIDSRMLHATGVSEATARPFRRLSTRYAHPDTRYLDLGDQAAVFWRMLPHGLSTGDPVASKVFPLIKQRFGN